MLNRYHIKTNRIILLFFIGFLYPKNIFASEQLKESFSFELNESLIFRRSSSAQASAGTIATAETSQLLNRGFLTLEDYLNTLPDFDITGATWQTWPGARGIHGAVNFLIEGLPLTDPIDYRYPSGLDLFLEEFDRVETIGGPAGVLWGSHALLGTINLLNNRTKERKTLVKGTYGTRDLNRLVIQDTRPLGHDTSLRLFFGYASQRHFSLTPPVVFTAVPPYGDDGGTYWQGTTNTQPTTPDNNYNAVLSARYETPHTTTYLRLPISYQEHQLSYLGGLFSPNNGGTRRAFDSSLSFTYQDSLFEGNMAWLGRVLWHYLSEFIEKRYVVGPAAHSVLAIQMSILSAVLEGNYRLQGINWRSNTMIGMNAQLETPHQSYFYGEERNFVDLPPLPQGNVVAGNAQSLSAYVFDEFWLWERLGISGGSRINLSDSYKQTVLWQLNSSIRLFGESYAKFGISEGMRPPTLLDRLGNLPVVGNSRLKPEKSQSQQIELNGTWKNIGLFNNIFSRISYAGSKTDSLIIREGAINDVYIQNPVSTNGTVGQILSVGSQFEITNTIKIDTMYRRNLVKKNVPNKVAGSDIDRAPNHGPEHRWLLDLGHSMRPWGYGKIALSGQCGGDVNFFDPPDPAAAHQKPPTPPIQKLGCYHFVDLSIRIPAEIKQVGISITATNITNSQPPISMFLFPDFRGSEVHQPSATGRTLFASLEWIL